MNSNELFVVFRLKSVVNNFFDNHKASNYRKLVKKPAAVRQLSVNMSIKALSLFSYLDRFPVIL